VTVRHELGLVVGISGHPEASPDVLAWPHVFRFQLGLRVRDSKIWLRFGHLQRLQEDIEATAAKRGGERAEVSWGSPEDLALWNVEAAASVMYATKERPDMMEELHFLCRDGLGIVVVCKNFLTGEVTPPDWSYFMSMFNHSLRWDLTKQFVPPPLQILQQSFFVADGARLELRAERRKEVPSMVAALRGEGGRQTLCNMFGRYAVAVDRPDAPVAEETMRFLREELARRLSDGPVLRGAKHHLSQVHSHRDLTGMALLWKAALEESLGTSGADRERGAKLSPAVERELPRVLETLRLERGWSRQTLEGVFQNWESKAPSPSDLPLRVHHMFLEQQLLGVFPEYRSETADLIIDQCARLRTARDVHELMALWRSALRQT
jgi:hypothetical protein